MSTQYLKFAIVAVIVLIILAGWWFWRVFWPDKPNPQLPEKRITVGGADFVVETANTTSTRATGLSFRDSLAEGHGMLFEFPFAFQYGFWMRGMKFGLDLVWIKNDRVVGIAKNVPAPNSGASTMDLPVYYPPESVDKVLEIGAGEAEKKNLQIGDPVKI